MRPPPRSRVFWVLIAVAVLLGAGALSLRTSDWGPLRRSAEAAPGAAEVLGGLTTVNAVGRSGAFFLPADYDRAALPVLVAIHGTGGNGAQMVATFQEAARRRRFIVVAPDSRRSPGGAFTWEVGDHPGDVTPDFEHVRRCLAEVLAMPGVKIDAAHVLIAGHSGGGSLAPYVATNAEPYTAFAVLHGGAYPGGLGVRDARGWFSTGSADPLRPPSLVRAAADSVRRAGFTSVQYREFQEGHDVGPVELGELLRWWLGG